ncbi:MAG: YraN family protein [Bdellovibrionota bacterium]
MPSFRQKQGTNFENDVVRFLEARGYSILATKYRVPLAAHGYRRRAWVEIDILSENPGDSSLWIVEAKNHCNAASSGLPLLSRAQYLRLMRALQALRRKEPKRQVFWALAWRNPHGGVEFSPNPCYF